MNERSYCEIAEHGCRNPAGFRVNGKVCKNLDPERTSWRCPKCESVACASCRRRGLCYDCAIEAFKEGSAE